MPPTVATAPGESGLVWPRRLAAEAFGTFALVFVAVGGDAMATMSGGQVSPAARAIAPALMVAALIYALGDRSGAHFNPAVSLAFALRRLFPASWVIPYWLAQAVGALAAAATASFLFGGAARTGVPSPHVSDAAALVLEAILTLLLVTVILGTADRYRIVGHEAALAVGATIALCGLIALPVEGAAMNPARAVAPAIVEGAVGSSWIYVIGPIIGAVVAVGIAWFLHGDTESDARATEAARGDDAREPGPRGSRTAFRQPNAGQHGPGVTVKR